MHRPKYKSTCTSSQVYTILTNETINLFWSPQRFLMEVIPTSATVLMSALIQQWDFIQWLSSRQTASIEQNSYSYFLQFLIVIFKCSVRQHWTPFPISHTTYRSWQESNPGCFGEGRRGACITLITEPYLILFSIESKSNQHKQHNYSGMPKVNKDDVAYSHQRESLFNLSEIGIPYFNFLLKMLHTSTLTKCRELKKYKIGM